jgi:hypothetical protein
MYIVYKTTNKINNKFYIGVHNMKCPWYKGSGTHLKNSIKKYGRENFIRETLFIFETSHKAYEKEAELVTFELVADPMCYNLKLGGKGGKSGIIVVKDVNTGETIGAVANDHPNVISGKWVHVLKGRDTFARAREASIKARIGKPGGRLGYKASAETKELIRKARSGTKQSTNTIYKKSEALKGKSKPITTCPHCGKTGGVPSLSRWHFDNCKYK